MLFCCVKEIELCCPKLLETLSLGIFENEEDNNEEVGHSGSEVCYNVDNMEDFGQIMFDMLRPYEVT